MKFTLTLLIAILFCTAPESIQAQTNECPVTMVTGYHESGEVRYVAEVDCHNKFNGHYVEYNTDGSLFGMGQFKDGTKVGMWTVYPINMTKTYVVHYDDRGFKQSAVIMENNLVVEVRHFK